MTLLEVAFGLAIVAALSVAALPLLVEGERASRMGFGDSSWDALRQALTQHPLAAADLDGPGIEHAALEGAPVRVDRVASDGEWTWVLVRWKDAWLARPVREAEALPSEALKQGEETP